MTAEKDGPEVTPPTRNYSMYGKRRLGYIDARALLLPGLGDSPALLTEGRVSANLSGTQSPGHEAVGLTALKPGASWEEVVCA